MDLPFYHLFQDENGDLMYIDVSDSQTKVVKDFFSQNVTSIPKEREKCHDVSSISKCIPFTTLIKLQPKVTGHFDIAPARQT